MTQPIRCVTVPVLATASMILVLGGCGDLLDPEVYGDLTPETFFSNEEDFKNAVVALYAPFSTHWGNTDQGVGEWYNNLYNHHTTTYWARSEIPTDEMFSPWDPVFNNFDWGPTTFNGDPTYTKIRYVARATDIIDKIETSSAPISDAVRARYEAEARTLRAWLMYAMYDFFGPVNVKLDPATLSDTEITPRPSREEYVSAMVEDLTSAILDLPERVSGEDWGRVAKGTARMILLRVYMHDKDWAAAEAVARDVEAMGYSLMSEYSDVCNVQENEETIYAVPANASSPNWYWQEITPSDFASAGSITRVPGWYGYWMPWPFYDTYTAADGRLSTVISDYMTDSGSPKDRNSGLQGAIPFKCTQELGASSGASLDWPVFRYAETMLSLAEAINEQRGPDEALPYVNQVRARAGLPAWSGLSQAALRDSLLAERGRELYAEGVRRQDLIRHGKFIEFAQTSGLNAQDHHVLYPIPLEVITQGAGVIEQNPGY